MKKFADFFFFSFHYSVNWRIVLYFHGILWGSFTGFLYKVFKFERKLNRSVHLFGPFKIWILDQFDLLKDLSKFSNSLKISQSEVNQAEIIIFKLFSSHTEEILLKQMCLQSSPIGKSLTQSTISLSVTEIQSSLNFCARYLFTFFTVSCLLKEKLVEILF